jgi:hypothetical protein
MSVTIEQPGRDGHTRLASRRTAFDELESAQNRNVGEEEILIPGNDEWQRKKSSSLRRLDKIAVIQGDLPES